MRTTASRCQSENPRSKPSQQDGTTFTFLEALSHLARRLYTTLNCASCPNETRCDSLTAMVQETIKARTRTVKPNEIYGQGEDQEQMIEEALSAIRKIGAAAVLERCRMVADLIDAQLEGVNSEQFANTSSVSDLEAFLGRAAAVLKTIRDRR